MVSQSEGNRFSIINLTSLPGDRRYVRNLGNTTLTVLLTIPLMTALYFFIWYPGLNRSVVGVSQDTVVSKFFADVNESLIQLPRQKPGSHQ